jgi:hypothetical protein
MKQRWLEISADLADDTAMVEDAPSSILQNPARRLETGH